jgi:RNA polymerase sigma-70 factor (ECF subfamily)
MDTTAAAGERGVVDETALVEALRQGDRDAFATLVDANSPWMMRIALSHVSTRASAEDAVQEAWLRCLNGLDGFEGRSALKSWLFVIVTNCARRRAERDSRSVPFSELARREAERSEPEALEGRFFDDSHPRWPGGWTSFNRSWESLPEQRLLAGEVSERIESAAARLPEGQRAVFLLRDVEGWGSEEVCNALGISGSNQRVLLHRARHTIRAVLEDYLEGVEPQ